MENKVSQIMLINMGGKGNIGDRAMALNDIQHIRKIAPDVNILVGPHTLEFMVEEFNLKKYSYLSHCLQRWYILENKVNKLLYKLLLPFKYLYFILDICFVLLLVLAQHHLKFRLNKSFSEAELSQAICDSDLVFFCGGGYINDVGKFDSRTNLLMAYMARLINKPVIMSGQGLGPFDSFISEWLIKKIIPKVNLVTFRDYANSRLLLEDYGVYFNGYEVGDDAMSLPISKSKIENYNGIRIGINFRISPFTPDLDQKLSEFTRFINLIANETDWQICFFVFETWRPWEEKYIEDIINQANVKNYIVIKTEDPREALSYTSSCDITVGISYHFIVFSLMLGIPTIALYTGDYYKFKMKGLLSWYNRSDWAVSITDTSNNKLFDLCKKLLTITQNEKNDLINQTKIMAENHLDTIKKALSILER